MMKPLLRGNQELRLWDDSLIQPGEMWRTAIEMALAEAKVALLLVSDHFLASDFVMDEEVPKLLAAARAEGVPVLWVSLSPSFVEETEIHHYQAVLPPSRHLEAMAEVEVKQALKTIGLAIRKALLEPWPAGGRDPAEPQAKPAPSPSQPATPVSPQASPPPQAQQPPPDRVPPQAGRPPDGVPPMASIPGLPSQPLALETARILRQGNGWQVEKRPLQVERALLPLGDGESLPLLWIPAGEFVMGSPGDEPERMDREGPQYRVRLEGFWLGQTPVTQAQWRVVAKLVPPLGQSWLRELKAAPSYFQPEADTSDSTGRFALLPGEASSDQRPVERVSWHDAIEFCRRLVTLLPTDSGLRCRLPSEAQWEYACRAESSTPFPFGETLSPELANYDGNYTYANGPKGYYRKQTTPVGMFPANAWGLHDMHGNVWEWCLDHWHDTYRNAPFAGEAWLDSEPVNMQANDDRSRLLRGGSWGSHPGNCRSACRDDGHPGSRGHDVGFRVCCLPQD